MSIRTSARVLAISNYKTLKTVFAYEYYLLKLRLSVCVIKSYSKFLSQSCTSEGLINSF